MGPTDSERLRVLVAGGGVAGVETALALHELAGEKVAVTLLAPERDFVQRPARVAEPLTGRPPLRIPLADIARHAGAELLQDQLSRVDAGERLVHTKAGRRLGYDALVLALGTTAHPRFRHALTIDETRLNEQFTALLEDVADGGVDRIGFLVPSRMPWPLPIYELALMTARRAAELGKELTITVVTPEDAPLGLFGIRTADAVSGLLAEHGVACVVSAHAETPAPGKVAVHPGPRLLTFDRVVALPELFGPDVPGVPSEDGHGFIPVDPHCAVRGLEAVYAAGDATAFPIKHGAIAAQQAETVAASIAARAGVPIEAHEFRPVVDGILLGAERPLHMSAHITGGHGSSPRADEATSWSPETMISARYLGAYLQRSRDARLRRSLGEP